MSQKQNPALAGRVRFTENFGKPLATKRQLIHRRPFSSCARISQTEIAETSTNKRAGPAARAKKASSVALQMRVARVLKPVGPRSRVAGSSFIPVKKTRARPASRPGLIRGRVIEKRAWPGVRPKTPGRFFQARADLQ